MDLSHTSGSQSPSYHCLLLTQYHYTAKTLLDPHVARVLSQSDIRSVRQHAQMANQLFCSVKNFPIFYSLFPQHSKQLTWSPFSPSTFWQLLKYCSCRSRSVRRFNKAHNSCDTVSFKSVSAHLLMNEKKRDIIIIRFRSYSIETTYCCNKIIVCICVWFVSCSFPLKMTAKFS